MERTYHLARDFVPPKINSGSATYPPTDGVVVVERHLDDCFLLTHGWGIAPKVAAVETAETAVLGYRLLQKKRFYVKAPSRCMQQVFKVSAKKLWRLRATYGESAASLGVLFLTSRTWRVAGTHDIRAYLYHRGVLSKLLPFSLATSETTFLGEAKNVEVDENEGFLTKGDTILLTTRELLTSINEKKLEEMLIELLAKNTAMETIAQSMLSEAVSRRRAEKYVMWVIQKEV